MTRPVKTGRVLQTGVITARDIAASLRLGTEQVELRPPDSPQQARLRAEGKDREADALANDDFTVTRLSEADAWDAFGRPPLGPPANAPDGTPCPIEPQRDYEPERRRPIDAAPSEQKEAPQRTPTPNEAAEQLRQDFRAHAKRQVEGAVAAQQSGDPARTAAAVENVRETVSLGTRLKEKLGRL